MHKRTKALQISQSVKKAVYERDGGRCIICEAPGDPVCHFISRGQGGLGIEENVLTLCWRCHMAYDQGPERRQLRGILKKYLQSEYPEWDESKLVYRKGQ